MRITIQIIERLSYGVIDLALTGTLVGFGGNNAGVVAAVLVYRFLTAVPTLILGLGAAFTIRRRRPPGALDVSSGPGDAGRGQAVEAGR